MPVKATPKPKVHLKGLALASQSMCGLRSPKTSSDKNAEVTCKTCKNWYAKPENKKFYTNTKRKANANVKREKVTSS